MKMTRVLLVWACTPREQNQADWRNFCFDSNALIWACYWWWW